MNRYLPVRLKPSHDRSLLTYPRGKCPVAAAFCAQALSLPLYLAMTDADVARVIDPVLALAPQGVLCPSP